MHPARAAHRKPSSTSQSPRQRGSARHSVHLQTGCVGMRVLLVFSELSWAQTRDCPRLQGARLSVAREDFVSPAGHAVLPRRVAGPGETNLGEEPPAASTTSCG